MMIFSRTSKQLLVLGAKFLIFLPAMMLSCLLQAADAQNVTMTKMRIKVVLFDKDNTPVDGVMVFSPDGGNPMMSRNGGVVTLIFTRLKPGDPVAIKIDSEKYKIVNITDDDEIKTRLPNKEDKSYFHIIVSEQADIVQRRMEYIRKSIPTFSVSGYVHDYCDRPIVHATVSIKTVLNNKQTEFKKETDIRGYYQIDLPALPEQKWFISFKHEDYKDVDYLGPHLKNENISIDRVMDQSGNKLEISVRFEPKYVELLRDNKKTHDVKAYVWNCDKPRNETIVWKIPEGSIPGWLEVPRNTDRIPIRKSPVIERNADEYNRYEYKPNASVGLVSLSFNEEKATQSNYAPANLDISFFQDRGNVELFWQRLTVYADEKPKVKELAVSGFVHLSDGTVPYPPVSIMGEDESGNDIPEFHVTTRDNGYFQANINNDYAKQKVKLVIDDGRYVAKSEESTWVSSENGWATIIELKSKDQANAIDIK